MELVSDALRNAHSLAEEGHPLPTVDHRADVCEVATRCPPASGYPVGPSPWMEESGVRSAAENFNAAATGDLNQAPLQLTFPEHGSNLLFYESRALAGGRLVVALPLRGRRVLAIRPRTRCVVGTSSRDASSSSSRILPNSNANRRPSPSRLSRSDRAVRCAAPSSIRRTYRPEPAETRNRARHRARPQPFGCSVGSEPRRGAVCGLAAARLRSSPAPSDADLQGDRAERRCRASRRRRVERRHARWAQFDWGPGEEVHSVLEQFIEEIRMSARATFMSIEWNHRPAIAKDRARCDR